MLDSLHLDYHCWLQFLPLQDSLQLLPLVEDRYSGYVHHYKVDRNKASEINKQQIQINLILLAIFVY